MDLNPESASPQDVPFNRKHIMILFVICFLSLALRLALTSYNRDANDPHRPVIVYIMKYDALPEKKDCWECFQPKTFHYLVAKTLAEMGLQDHGNDNDAQKITGQLMNFLAGVLTLCICWIFISQFTGRDPGTSLLSFAMLAFNPQLIGINSQLTNDSFLIMFCTLAIYCTYLFLKKTNTCMFVLMITFSVLAVTTKANGWVMVIAIAATLFIKFLSQRSWHLHAWVYLAIYLFSIPILATLSPTSQYIHNYRQYGTPFVLNMQRKPPPLLFQKTDSAYAGILSIQDGFFTFKLIDLIEHPITPLIENAGPQSARTSLWTYMYGSANSLHFENYPPSWRTNSKGLLMANRAAFILALIPFALMLAGGIWEVFFTIKALAGQNRVLLQDVSFGLFALLYTGFTLFMALYAFEYRVYIFFKAIFVFPALLAFPVLFQRGFMAAPFSSSVKYRILTILIVALIFAYMLDVGILISQLTRNGFGLTELLEALINR